MGRTHSSPGHLLLVALGLLVLSHVCCQPAHTDGFAVLAGHAHDAHDGPSADDSVHGASCEALRSTVTSAPSALAAAPTRPTPLVTEGVPSPLGRPLAVFAPSPPLFLLHASLLI